jgi:hypothetical protein
MRRWAIAALAMCGGCNWVFGLESTTSSKQPDARPFGMIRMSQLVGPSTNGADQAPTQTRPMPDPHGRFASLDGDFQPIEKYDEATGEFPYPAELANQQWRFEYTLPGQVPHELQWQPAEGIGHIVVPVFGRPDREKQKPNTGFVVKPPSTFFATGTELFTTGYWTQTLVTAQPLEVNLDFSTLAPVSGDFGVTNVDDRIVALGPFEPLPTTTDCFQRAVIASASAPVVSEQVLTPITLANDAEPDSAAIDYVGGSFLPFGTRLNDALGRDEPGTRKGSVDGRVYFGRLAHSQLPAFTTTIGTDDVPAPFMLPLAWCPYTTMNAMNFNIGMRIRWPLAAYAFLANDRVVSGVRLRSSLATITLKDGSSDDYLLDYPIKIAIKPKLGGADLDLGPDNQAIPNTPADLTFDFEDAPSSDVDYYEITLYRLAGTALQPVRVYVGATEAKKGSIHFDPAIMMPNEEYVFAIRTIRGRPEARAYNFLPVTLPQAIATVFTKTFHR